MEVVIVLLAASGVAWWLLRSRLDARTPPPTPATQPPVPAPAPARPPQAETGRWIPLGETITVHGATLPGGIYVGSALDAVSGWRGAEPALIDPQLPVRTGDSNADGPALDYWPAYADITPAARGTYLRWLAAGCPPGVPIGYVLLRFYGIERRVLFDGLVSEDARADIPALREQVARLLVTHGDDPSFRSVATDFLTTARVIAGATAVDGIVPPRTRTGWDVPLDVRLALGTFAAHGEPLPGDWALAWALHNPALTLRTPATRCPEELADLFLARYAERHGDGLVLKPTATKLRLPYRPASASFAGPISLAADGLTDVTQRSGPTRMLGALLSAVTDELDAYSRHLGRHDDRASARAVALLPPVLAGDRTPAPLRDLARAATEAPQVIAATTLTRQLEPVSVTRLPKRDAVALAQLLAAQGVGLEPDVRVGPINFSHHEHAVLWRELEPSAPAGDGFPAATVLLHLGVAVGVSDGGLSAVEREQLETALERAFDLPDAGQRRLRAHLAWLVAEQPGVAGLKPRVRELGAPERALVARCLLAVAGADGHVSAREIERLQQLYRLLDLDPDAVHRDLHELESVPRGSGDGLLDRGRLADVLASTRNVADVLSGVFADDEPDEAPAADDDGDGDGDDGTLAGLDAAHSALVRRLAAKPAWTRADLDELAAPLGLLPGGAIETINDVAFDQAGAPLLEGDDPVELDGHVLKELLHA